MPTLRFDDQEPEAPAAQPNTQPTATPPWWSAVQGIGDILPAMTYGAEKSVANMAQTGASIFGSQGLQDFSSAVNQDAQGKVPNFTGRPVRQFNWDVASGLPIMGASAIMTLATDNPLLGAAVQAPDVMGGTISEVKSRGGTDDQAMSAGLDNAALSTAIMSLPMHQLTTGGTLLNRVLKNSAVNAAAGFGLTTGQEEILKANDVKPLPEGQEFSNSIYSSLVGGVTGGVLGVMTPAEQAIDANKVADMVLDQKVKEGVLTTQQAQGARQELIRNIQDLAIKTRFQGGNTTDKINEIVNSPNKNEEVIRNGKVYVFDQGDGGSTKEVENVLPSASSDQWQQATKIVNQAFTEVERDSQGRVVRDKNGVPKIKGTQTDKMPIEFQHALYNDIITKIQQGQTHLDILDQVMNKTLPSQQPNVIFDFGRRTGERPAEENVFSPKFGALSIKDLAAETLKAGVDPASIKIYHASEDSQTARDVFKTFSEEAQKTTEQAKAIHEQTPQPPAVLEHQGNWEVTPPEQPVEQQSIEGEPEVTPQVPYAGPNIEAPFQPQEPQAQTEGIAEALNDMQEKQVQEADAHMTQEHYDNIPSKGPQDALVDESISEALGTDKDTESLGQVPPSVGQKGPGEVHYQKDIIKDVEAGKIVKEFEFKNAGTPLKGADAKTGAEVELNHLDGKFKVTAHEDGSMEFEGADKHAIVSQSAWAKFITEQGRDIEGGEQPGFAATEHTPLAKGLSAKPTPAQKATSEVVKSGAQLSQQDLDAISSGYVDLQKDFPKAIKADETNKLSTGLGTPIQTHELEADIDPNNIRSFPAKVGFQLASMSGNRAMFMTMMEHWMGKAKFDDTFKVGKAVPVDHEIVQGLMEDKRLVDLVNFMATDNLRPAMQVLWQVAAEKAGPQAKRADIQKVYNFLDSLMSRAAEEVTSVEGDPNKYSKSFIGMGLKEFARSGQPGTRDEWRDRDNFVKDYSNFLTQMGKPIPPGMEGRPELAFFNLLKEAGGDRAVRLMMWSKAELEHASFAEMVKAGVFQNRGVSSMVFHGYSPRSWEYKGLQKDNASSRGFGGGSPTDRTAGTPEREALNYSDFVGRARDLQGLNVNESYLGGMHEYVTKSMLKASQFRTLNWLRTFTIPDTNLKLKSFEGNAVVKQTIRNLKYVEYKNSDNIQALVKETGLRENDILQQLGYIQDKDREGLVSWNRFSFEPPYLQATLSDILDNVYPQTPTGVFDRKVVGALNIPKRILTLNPFQHTLLFAGSVLANSGFRTPVVLGKYLGTGARLIVNAPFAVAAAVKGEAQTHDIFGKPIEQDYRGMENLPRFIKDGFGVGWASLAPGLFEDSKLTKFFIPEMMTPQQVQGEALSSVLNMNRIMFDQFLTRELYAVTNARYEQFRNMTGPDGQRLMDDAEASRRAVTLVNSTSGVVHQASFGKYGPMWSLMTFARGLTIAPLRVISGTVEPTLRKIYGQKSADRYKIDPLSGLLNPVTMGDISPKDADFLQAYYAQHLAKIIGLRLLVAGVVQYALSYLDDDKKDEFGQQGSDPMNKKRFLYNNASGFRMSIRTPWTDVNGRRVMLDPTYLRESKTLLDTVGLSSRYRFPASAINWMESRMNAWQDMVMGAINGVDPGTGQKFADKDTDEYTSEVQNWLMGKIMPLSLGVTQEEKQQQIPGNNAANWALRLSSTFGSTPKTAPVGWYNYGERDNYERLMKADKEFKTQQQKEKDMVGQLSAQQILNKKLSTYFSAKTREDAYLKKVNPTLWVKKTMAKAAHEYNITGKVDEEGNVSNPGINPEDDQRQQQMAQAIMGGQ